MSQANKTGKKVSNWRMTNMTPEQRSAQAKKAGQASAKKLKAQKAFSNALPTYSLSVSRELISKREYLVSELNKIPEATKILEQITAIDTVMGLNS